MGQSVTYRDGDRVMTVSNPEGFDVSSFEIGDADIVSRKVDGSRVFSTWLNQGTLVLGDEDTDRGTLIEGWFSATSIRFEDVISTMSVGSIRWLPDSIEIMHYRGDDSSLTFNGRKVLTEGDVALSGYLTTNLDAGQTMNAIIQGGAPPYTVQWNYPNGTRVQRVSGPSIKFDSSQSGEVTATITDSAGSTFTTDSLPL